MQTADVRWPVIDHLIVVAVSAEIHQPEGYPQICQKLQISIKYCADIHGTQNPASSLSSHMSD